MEFFNDLRELQRVVGSSCDYLNSRFLACDWAFVSCAKVNAHHPLC